MCQSGPCVVRSPPPLSPAPDGVAIAAAGCTLLPFVHIVHAQVAAKFCITRRIRKSRHVSEPFIGCSQGFHWQLTGWIKALAFGTASSAIDSLISSQAHRPCLFP